MAASSSPRRLLAIALALLAIGTATPRRACASGDDYIDETFVYSTLRRGEFELEGVGDARGGASRPTRTLGTTGFEYGLTDRWTIDAGGSWDHLAGGNGFSRLRAETRVRLGEAGRGPLDAGVSVEYEHERAGDGWEDTVAPRIVLSRALAARLDTSLNLDFPLPLEGGGEAGFVWALGVRYPVDGTWRGGIEYRQEPDERLATVFPQLWFIPRPEWTLKLGAGIGMTPSTTPLIARLALEIEL